MAATVEPTASEVRELEALLRAIRDAADAVTMVKHKGQRPPLSLSSSAWLLDGFTSDALSIAVGMVEDLIEIRAEVFAGSTQAEAALQSGIAAWRD